MNATNLYCMRILFILLLTSSFCLSCKPHVTYNDPVPQHDSITIASQILNENRTINIWLPPGYHPEHSSYPVIYMLDGGIQEDFPHLAQTIENLIKAGKIPEYILVGIENTDRRKDLTGPSDLAYDLKYVPNPGGSDQFRAFIAKELMPEINQNYSTQKHTAVIGESIAGLFVIETFLLDNSLFDDYIAFDPSLWYNNQYLVENFEQLALADYHQKKKLWFAGSDAKDIYRYTRRLKTKLETVDRNLIWQYADEPQEKHYTIFRATKEKALIWTLNQKN